MPERWIIANVQAFKNISHCGEPSRRSNLLQTSEKGLLSHNKIASPSTGSGVAMTSYGSLIYATNFWDVTLDLLSFSC